MALIDNVQKKIILVHVFSQKLSYFQRLVSYLETHNHQIGLLYEETTLTEMGFINYTERFVNAGDTGTITAPEFFMSWFLICQRRTDDPTIAIRYLFNLYLILCFLIPNLFNIPVKRNLFNNS